MEYDEELVDIVNEKNEVVGKATRGEAHKKGSIHRALSVLILNFPRKDSGQAKVQILLQKRSANKRIHPLSWDLSTSEHVLAGESYEEAGIRSVKEELGVDVEVKRINETSLQKREHKVDGEVVYDNEIVTMLIASHNGPFKLDPNEVEQVQFFSVEEIENMIKNGEDFTVWFLEEWENVKRVIKA